MLTRDRRKPTAENPKMENEKDPRHQCKRNCEIPRGYAEALPRSFEITKLENQKWKMKKRYPERAISEHKS
jgi:hypothetical protein